MQLETTECYCIKTFHVIWQLYNLDVLDFTHHAHTWRTNTHTHARARKHARKHARTRSYVHKTERVLRAVNLFNIEPRLVSGLGIYM